MSNILYVFAVSILIHGSQAQIYNVTNRESFAYQVSVTANSTHICGGAIYNSKHVITSASCINGTNVTTLEVVAGDLNLDHSNGNQTQKVAVKQIIIHEKFNKTANDIAILKLSKALRFDNSTKGLEVLKKWNDSNTNGGKCVVSGWGANNSQVALNKDLHAANVSIFSLKTCQTLHKNISDGNFCAGDASTLQNFCVGDAGGPLVCNGTLHGIVSQKTVCNVSSVPGIYTNASYYHQWIRDKANSAHTTNPFILLSATVIIFNVILGYNRMV